MILRKDKFHSPPLRFGLNILSHHEFEICSNTSLYFELKGGEQKTQIRSKVEVFDEISNYWWLGVFTSNLRGDE